MFQEKVISTKTRMAGLLVLSSLIHFYAFTFFPEGKKETQKPFIISASIVIPSAVNNGSNIKEETKKTPPDKKVISTEKNKTTKTNNKKKTAHVNPDANTNTKPAKATSHKADWFKIKSDIKSKIQQSFYYPRLAVRNNWQGTVLLSLTIDYSGKVTRHKVMHSSGFSILDNAALKTISKIERINISKNTQYYDPMNIQLPVTFKLNEG